MIVNPKADTEAVCHPYLNDDIPKLERKMHIAWLEKGLGVLPERYTVLDASRPWIIYWILGSLTTLGVDMEQYRDRVLLTLKTTWHPNGGFGGNFGQIGHLAPTYAAINALILVGGNKTLEIFDRDVMYKWILSLKQPDGSFKMHHGGEIDARAVYCALTIATHLNMLTPELTAGTAEWLGHCQSFEGGMAPRPGAEAHAGYSFCVLAALCILGPPKDVLPKHLNLDAFMRWMMARQLPYEGGFSGRTNKLVDGCYSWWVGGCFPLVEAALEYQDTPIWNRAGLEKYVLSCCQSNKGGLRDKPGKNPDFYHSCYALAGLSVSQTDYNHDETASSKPGVCALQWSARRTTERLIIPENEVTQLHPIFVLPFDKIAEFRNPV
ncbi:Protein farnesyltransferase subunit beta [Neolecta irregularis DAH-3]|uniref:Protein farnesyltransferase subunit beta n=1 Tax=Neolecta irregularis (strain DAH-3) TaxID=1198029 RepID=A0A1U7LMK3_NEOID|nr:Protein farnesyltransferase subunit beta [Neolecta irregularis DAH-3]|eukprot:OLL23877.1 Protein farnesyltransferase subunit beta [Neolecta irregularis DAH-3]